MNKVLDNLADALDVERIQDQEETETLPTEQSLSVVPINSLASREIYDSSVEEDVTKARDGINDILEVGRDALEDLAILAKEDDQARPYEVMAQLIKTLIEGHKDRLDIHKKARDLRTRKDDKGRPSSGGMTVNAEQVVFTGSTRELLEKVRRESPGSE